MKKRYFTFILVVIVLLSLGGMRKAEVEKIDAIIKKAESRIFSSTGGRGDNPEEGLKLLLDAIELTASNAKFPAEFKNKIAQVNKVFKETSILNLEGIALINEAYSSINSGKEFQVPDTISTIDDAVAYCRNRIKKARKDLKEGNYSNSVKLLVETVLMVVTPIHGEL